MIHGLSNDAEDRTEAARFGLAEMVSKALFAMDSLDFLGKNKKKIGLSLDRFGNFPDIQICLM